MARLFFLLSTAGRQPSGAVGSMGKEWKGSNSPNFLQDYINNQYDSICINYINMDDGKIIGSNLGDSPTLVPWLSSGVTGTGEALWETWETLVSTNPLDKS